ncbi:MAG: hypothetical protein AAB478_03190 [Patescibacteria group bacterium]
MSIDNDRRPSVVDRIKAKGDFLVPWRPEEAVEHPTSDGGRVVFHPRLDRASTAQFRDVETFRPVLLRPSDVVHLYNGDNKLVKRSRARNLPVSER